ncbi:MAG: DUF502 domain-containing protein [Desulfovibrio sp.]|nr:MAG: DUF502 domain-containing protein [Desulfovibrio sp.]
MTWLLRLIWRPFGLLWRLVKHIMKTNMLAGLLVLTPIVATVYFLHFLISAVDRILLLLPERYQPDTLLGFHIPGLGLILVIIVLFLTGLIVRNVMGRKVVTIGERILAHIPFVSKFYNALKQLIEAIFQSSIKDFQRVVLIEYPRLGVYTLGFVTGEAMGEIQRKTKQHVINLFVPTTPNPTSGFYLMVPEEDLIPLDMGVEDAFKLLISGGILNPEDNRTALNGEQGPTAPESKEERS